MGAGARSVNVVDVGCVSPNEVKFEALYNEEVNFLANQAEEGRGPAEVHRYSMIFGTVEIPDMPADTDVLSATTGDEVRVEKIVVAGSEISLADTTMVGSSVTNIPGTDAQDQSVALSTDSPIDGATA
uniref:Integrase core domain containing protein n=1 Tax=Solanum tuberosum TaxID=4113 RepID=M1DIV9_SOLTU